MNTKIEHIYLIFIILILAIGTGYWLNTSKSREGFEETPSNNLDIDDELESEPEPARTTKPQTTNPQQAMQQISNRTSTPTQLQAITSVLLSAAINNQLSSVSDSTTRDILLTQLTNLQTLLSRYATLDIPIVMNDDGNLCSMWSDYADGRYREKKNQCLALDNMNLSNNLLKCLDITGIPTTCSNIMADGYITSKSNINYQSMLDSVTSSIINALPTITTKVSEMKQTADTIITSLADRGSIQLQQKELIHNNNENMAYKNKIMNDNTEKLNKKQNDTNINQNDFSSFMNQITNADLATNIYYKIIIGLLIAIVIMGILNFLFSNILT